MLKYICKTFLIALISGTLLNFQMSVAMAGVTATKGETTTDSMGVTTSSKNYKFDKISDSDMLASLGMLAAGFITGRMIKAYTPVTTDVMIAGAAGAAFIAGEILSNLKFKGTIDEMTVEVQKRSDAKINEEQIQRLKDLKKSYEEAKKTTKTKKMLQTASAVAFGVAAAWATYLAISEEGQAASCNAALAVAQAKIDACLTSGVTGVTATEVTQCGACKTTLIAYSAKYKSYLTSRKPPALSEVKEKAISPLEKDLMLPTNYCSGLPSTITAAVSKSIGATCGTSVKTFSVNSVDTNIRELINGIGKANNSFSKKSYYAYNNINNFEKIQKSFFEKSLDFILPTAQAGWLPLLGLGASTAVAFFGLTGTAAVEIDMMMYVPQNRAIAFAALGGVALLAANSSDNVIAELDENIKKIDKILADLEKNVLGTKTQNIATQAVVAPAINSKAAQTEDPISKTQALTPCMTSNDSTNCKPITPQLVKTPGFGNLPDSFKNIATQATKLGDDLSGSKGISGAAMTSAEGLANKQSAVKALLKDRQEALTKLTNGKFSPQKDGEKFLDRLKASIKKDLRNRGTTATGMMASLGVAPINSADTKPETEEKKSANNQSEVSAANVAEQSEEKKDGEAAGLNLDFSEAPAEGVVAANGVAAQTPEYDVTTNEIGKENGPSIFEVISSRYLKSGYPKLLDEEPAKN